MLLSRIIPLRMPRPIAPLRPRRMPRRLPIMELSPLFDMDPDMEPDGMAEPARAADRLGAGTPALKPMCMESTTAEVLAPFALYLLLHLVTARRVIASIRPVTWVMPQPSSRSCC